MRRPLEGIRVIEPERSDEAKGFAEKLAAMLAVREFDDTRFIVSPS